MSVDAIIESIRRASLSDDEIQQILQALMEKMMGEAMLAVAMDLMMKSKEERDVD